MPALDYFDQIYVVNLPYRQDRRQEMAQQLRSIGLSFDSPGVRLFAATRPEERGEFESVGTRGCFLSHLGVLRDARDRGFERIVLFEDDFDFELDFNARIPEIVDELKDLDWSLFYGGYEIQPAPLAENGKRLALATPSDAIRTAHFVCFRGPAIGEAVDFLEAMLTRPAGDPQGGPMHVDGAYSWFRAKNPARLTYLASSPLGYPRSSATDIHAHRWFDRLIGVRQAAAWMRRLRNAGKRRIGLIGQLGNKLR